MPPIKFKLNQTMFESRCDLKIFKMAVMISEETILAILNLHAAPIPSIKFPLHPTYGSGAITVEDFQDGCYDG